MKSVKNASKFLVQQLRKSYKTTGRGLAALDVPQGIIGTPMLKSDLDLFFTIAGTKGSSGKFSDIQVTVIKEKNGKPTVITVTAKLSITYTDTYEFDVDDARKGPSVEIGGVTYGFNEGSCQRHLQMLGLVKPFKDSVTGITTVQTKQIAV